MKLIINGENVEVPQTTRTIEQLLEHFELMQKVVIVEKNGEILTREEHPHAEISEGDRIEIVHFVGGG